MSTSGFSYKFRYLAQKLREVVRDKQDWTHYLRYTMNNVPYYLGFDWALFPHTIELIINSSCNARCLMCDIGLKNRNSQVYQVFDRGAILDIPSIGKLVNEVRFFKPTMTFAGTEPLLHPNIVEAIMLVKEAGLKCVLLTNGYLLPKFADKLCDSGLDYITISVDGTSDIHNKIRGVPHMFETIVEGITMLLARRNRPKVRIYTTITPLNQENLHEVADFFERLSVDNHTFVHMNFITEDMAISHNRLSLHAYPATETSNNLLDASRIDPAILQEQLTSIRKNYRRVAFLPPIFGKSQLERYYGSGDFIDGCNKCKIHWLTSTITANGDVLAFARCYNFVLGNIHQTSFMKIWNGDQMRQFRRDMIRYGAFPACSRCCAIFMA
ncbi:MAG: radical SAM/SPASM domain-containing protein [Candidatus Geothermarchaeales archaeon]